MDISKAKEIIQKLPEYSEYKDAQIALGFDPNKDVGEFYHWVDENHLSQFLKDALEPKMCQELRDVFDSIGVKHSVNEECCTSCAISVLSQKYPDQDAVWVNEQDVISMKGRYQMSGKASVYIGHMTPEGDLASDVALGKKVSDALRAHGFTVDWDDAPTVRIRVER